MIREVGLALIALALALRILIAPGFMPMFAHGTMTVSMCTGQGVVAVKLPGKAPMQKAHDPCPYGALASLPTIPPLAILPQAIYLFVSVLAPIAPAADRPHIGAPAPPPPPTGPPATA